MNPNREYETNNFNNISPPLSLSNYSRGSGQLKRPNSPILRLNNRNGTPVLTASLQSINILKKLPGNRVQQQECYLEPTDREAQVKILNINGIQNIGMYLKGLLMNEDWLKETYKELNEIKSTVRENIINSKQFTKVQENQMIKDDEFIESELLVALPSQEKWRKEVQEWEEQWKDLEKPKNLPDYIRAWTILSEAHYIFYSTLRTSQADVYRDKEEDAPYRAGYSFQYSIIRTGEGVSDLTLTGCYKRTARQIQAGYQYFYRERSVTNVKPKFKIFQADSISVTRQLIDKKETQVKPIQSQFELPQEQSKRLIDKEQYNTQYPLPRGTIIDSVYRLKRRLKRAETRQERIIEQVPVMVSLQMKSIKEAETKLREMENDRMLRYFNERFSRMEGAIMKQQMMIQDITARMEAQKILFEARAQILEKKEITQEVEIKRLIAKAKQQDMKIALLQKKNRTLRKELKMMNIRIENTEEAIINEFKMTNDRIDHHKATECNNGVKWKQAESDTQSQERIFVQERMKIDRSITQMMRTEAKIIIDHCLTKTESMIQTHIYDKIQEQNAKLEQAENKLNMTLEEIQSGIKWYKLERAKRNSLTGIRPLLMGPFQTDIPKAVDNQIWNFIARQDLDSAKDNITTALTMMMWKNSIGLPNITEEVPRGLEQQTRKNSIKVYMAGERISDDPIEQDTIYKKRLIVEADDDHPQRRDQTMNKKLTTSQRQMETISANWSRKRRGNERNISQSGSKTKSQIKEDSEETALRR